MVKVNQNNQAWPRFRQIWISCAFWAENGPASNSNSYHFHNIRTLGHNMDNMQAILCKVYVAFVVRRVHSGPPHA